MNNLSDSYWENKILAYLHDPFDKAFFIPGHEDRAQKLIDAFFGGNKTFNKKESYIKLADGIASGFERGQLPSYDKDPNKNGAVSFAENPELTHPTSKASLKFELPEELKSKYETQGEQAVAEHVNYEVANFLKTLPYVGESPDDINKLPQGESGAKARFFLLHLALRFYLANENIAGLGALWHKLPADTRFPNHSIWNHNSMVSAINSCIELGDEKLKDENVGLMVFTITPVQKFIATARKLRDYWTGSVILSYLAFEGIKYVMENLGPDHILYPSLIDQPLVLNYLKNYWKMDVPSPAKNANDIASFPNKFLALVPLNKAKEIGEGAKQHILKVWNEIAGLTEETIKKEIGLNDEEFKHLQKLFDRQTKDYWDIQWAAVKLVGKFDEEFYEKVLPKENYGKYSKLYDTFREILETLGFWGIYTQSGKGLFYSLSHQLSQSLLAATKTKRKPRANKEPGEKCHLCGEFEVLHSEPFRNTEDSASDYKRKTDDFWKNFWSKVRDEKGELVDNKDRKWPSEADFNYNEKLCAVCSIKRCIAMAMKKYSERELSDFKSLFSNEEKVFHYPMTSELALYSYFERKDIKNANEKRKIAQQLFEDESQVKDTTSYDKYYAILLMDGDRMGDLINGETIGSTWDSVIHTEMKKRLNNPDFYPEIRRQWQKIFGDKELNKMILTPALHSAISEALGDFAIYGVNSIVKKYNGELIYAGGDDVAAVLPVENVIDCAKEIREYYTSHFKLVKTDGKTEDVDLKENVYQLNLTNENVKICYHLGRGEKDSISISAGILICHFKEALFEMIKRAHNLLEKAKDEGCRNAFAIELRRRSGGSRYFISQWDDKGIIQEQEQGNASVLELFKTISNAISIKKDSKLTPEKISTSLVYRLEQMREGIDAILEDEKLSITQKAEYLKNFFKAQIERSGSFEGDAEKFAQLMVNFTVVRKKEKLYYKPERLIIASFLAKGGE